MSCSQSSTYPTMTMDLLHWVVVQPPLALLMGWHLNKISKKKNQCTWAERDSNNEAAISPIQSQATSLWMHFSWFSQEGKQMQDIRQSSASNDFSSIMRPFYYHCSHLNIHKHIHRKTKSTISFTVKKIKNSASNYQPQPGEPQQEVFHSLEF